jgi:hypothetical protein
MSVRFQLGQVVATPDTLEALKAAGQGPGEFLDRHVRGDWGDDLGEEDRKLNGEALTDCGRILSSYILKAGVKVWLITEACGDDGRRASSCLLLPENYLTEGSRCHSGSHLHRRTSHEALHPAR